MTCRERERKRGEVRPTGGNPWGLLQGWNQIHRVSKNEMPPYCVPCQPPFRREDGIMVSYRRKKKKSRNRVRPPRSPRIKDHRSFLPPSEI